tara:strand:+ start:24143 stop:25012 length:870 start_codon:yes stop_codon:yes gene_type:complete
MIIWNKLSPLLQKRNQGDGASENHRYTLHKEVGETPLQAIERSREERNISPSTKMAYAGRLDPMAEGKLLVLTGNYCSNIKKYWNLDKEYKVSIVLGLSSDSHDVLGKLTYTGTPAPFGEQEITDTIEAFTGKYAWSYPVISSKPVDGKPLFQWFLEGRLNEITVPDSTGEIFSLRVTGIRTIQPKDLRRRTLEKIHALSIVTDESKRLGRDFRRHEVIDSWNTWYRTSACALQVVDIVCVASAGTYMRTLANEIGKTLGIGALALEIRREKIGVFKKLGGWGFWLKQY